MNAEILAETNYEMSAEETLEIKAPEAGEPPAEFPCENKLGFTALCAGCYWAKFLNDCPKNIREKNNQQDELNVQEPLVEGEALSSLELDFNILPSYELVSGEDSTTTSSKVPVESVQPEQAAKEAVSQPEIISPSEPRSGSEPESELGAEPEAEQPRNYRDLLFDDSIEVVIAAPKPYVKLVETQPTSQEGVVMKPVFEKPTVIHSEPPSAEPQTIKTTAIEIPLAIKPTAEPTTDLASIPVEAVVVENSITINTEPSDLEVFAVEIENESERVTYGTGEADEIEEVEEDMVIPIAKPIKVSLEEKSDIYTFDFFVSEHVEPVVVQLEADKLRAIPLIEIEDRFEAKGVPPAEAPDLDSEVIPIDDGIETPDSTFVENLLAFEEEEMLPFAAVALRPESQKISIINPDEQDELPRKTPERLLPTLQKYGSMPFHYARSLMGVFALFALGIIDQ